MALRHVLQSREQRQRLRPFLLPVSGPQSLQDAPQFRQDCLWAVSIDGQCGPGQFRLAPLQFRRDGFQRGGFIGDHKRRQPLQFRILRLAPILDWIA